MFRSPFALLFACCFLAACGEALPTGAPQLKYGRFGAELEHDGALDLNETPHWLRLLVAKYQAPGDGDLPAQIAFLNVQGGCAFRKPSVGAKVVFLHANEFSRASASPIFTIAQSDIRGRAEALVGKWRQEGRDPGADTEFLKDNMNFVEVVVTENSAPLYLVLANREKAIWNIHAAAGVTIERVAMLTESATGVVNLDPATPVSVLTPSGLKGCGGLTPRREPSPKWGVMRALRDNPNSGVDRQTVASIGAAYSRFSNWFRENFGAGPEQAASGGQIIPNFLVGPAPTTREARIPYKRLKGATLLITPGDELAYGSRSAYAAKNSELVRAQATRLVGGDLAVLNKK